MKKILSIDGGGIRGMIPALILAEIETSIGKPISEIFDLVAGTSTGGILALALSKDNGQGNPRYSAKELVELYEREGEKIFPKSLSRTITTAMGMIDEKYPREGIDSVLGSYFGNDRLDSCLTKTLITSYDIEHREPFFFKSWREEHRSIKMLDAARSTSAAPTYFEPVQVAVSNQIKTLVDGGVFMNTPCVSAYAEALRIFPDEREFLVVSLGTGEQTRTIRYEQAKDWGAIEWLRPLLSCVFDGVSDAADYQMKQLLEGNYYRFQTKLETALDEMDNATPENIADLKTEAAILLKRDRENLMRLCEVL